MIRNIIFFSVFFLVAPSLIYIYHVESTRDLMTEEQAQAAYIAYRKCRVDEGIKYLDNAFSEDPLLTTAQVLDQLSELERQRTGPHPIFEKCSKLTGWNLNQ